MTTKNILFLVALFVVLPLQLMADNLPTAEPIDQRKATDANITGHIIDK